MQLLRVITTPHNLLLVSVWEQAGETMRFQLNAPGDWTALVLSGGVEWIYPSDLEPQPWVTALPTWDPKTRSATISWPGVIRMRGDLSRVLIRSTAPDTRVVCLAPLERDFLLAMLPPDLVDRVLSRSGYDGPLHQLLTVHDEAVQVDPRTLTKIDRGAALVDVTVVESTALNDLRRVLAPAVTPVGDVTRGGGTR